MRLRNLLLVLPLGAALAVLPAMASSETTPSIEAVSTGHGGAYGYETFAWSPTQTTVAAGGSVKFSTGSTSAPHGVVWTSAVKPTCDSTVPVGETSYAEHWNGTCAFTQPGTYTFHCSVHTTEMKGTITVTAAGTTTTTTSSSTTATPPPGTPPTTTTAPLASVLLPAVQRGSSVRGSANIGEAHSRLEVDLLAPAASLAKARKGRIAAGRLVEPSVGPGKVSFSVPLSAKAKRALRRHKRLALRVKIVVTPPGGASVSLTQGLLLRH